VLEKEANLNEPKSDCKGSSNNKSGDNNNNINLITALVKFEKGDSIRARFTFELATDNSGNDDDGATADKRNNRIKTLRIQFLK
jgi:hypothetical protein